MNIAVIPARGGSKRIPLKNIRLFKGKPMIAYSIECAIQSGLFDRVIVSTDDQRIAEVALTHGAEIPFFRPSELSDDHCGTTEVVAHATKWLQDQHEEVENVCCIYATAPFIDVRDLTQGYRLIQSGRWKFVFSATPFSFPIFRSFEVDKEGQIKMFFPEHFLTRSQDLPIACHDAAQFYWGTPDAWLQNLRIFHVHSTVVSIPKWRVHDIDDEEDWRRAEVMASYLLKE